MATSAPVASSVDVLSKSERELVVAGLTLKKASLERSIRTESNPEIRSLRSLEADAAASLILKFR